MTETNEEAAILVLEQQRIDASIAVDLAVLDAIFADDLVHVHSSGLVHDKAGLLAWINSRRAYVAIERSELRVRLYGDFALMTGRMTNHMRSDDGKRTLDGVVTQALRKIDGKWKYVSFQFTLG